MLYNIHAKLVMFYGIEYTFFNYFCVCVSKDLFIKNVQEQ